MSQSLLSSQSVDSMGCISKAMINVEDRVLVAEFTEGPGRPGIEICWGEN